MMDYQNMSTKEIKTLLVKEMRERESVHYVIGWLMQSYISPSDEDTERDVAIKQLREYGV